MALPNYRISIKDDEILYKCENHHSSIRIPDIIVIGEHTNEYGPSDVDYLVTFVTTEPDCWHDVSMYSEGMQAVLTYLGQKLGAEIVLGLCTSTSRASRILWPAHMRGKDLFTWEKTKPANAWERFKHWAFGTVIQRLSDTVMEEIKRRNAWPSTREGT